MKHSSLLLAFVTSTILSCNNSDQSKENDPETAAEQKPEQKKEYLSQPLVSHIYTADPSAHVFNGRIYIYPSHDTATGTKEDDLAAILICGIIIFFLWILWAVLSPITEWR